MREKKMASPWKEVKEAGEFLIALAEELRRITNERDRLRHGLDHVARGDKIVLAGTMG